MIPFDPLTVGSLLVMAASTSPLCYAPKSAEINVIPKSEAVKYDYSQSLAALQNHKVSTIDPYGFGDVTHTNGFMRGSVSMEPKVKIGFKDFPGYDAACVWYDTVEIQIKIDPTIVIASEVYADACMREAVLEHEMKHVKVDRQIVNKYAKIMGKKIFDGLKQRGFSAGPVQAAYKQSTADRMSETVGQLLRLEYQKMMIEREERQQGVDSLEEYKRVGVKCPDFNAAAALRSP